MSYPPRWNEGYESDSERGRNRRRSSEDPRWERERSESQRYGSESRYGRGRRDDDEGAFDSPSGFAERERWEQYEDWQQPRRMGGGYAEQRRFGEGGGFSHDEGFRRFGQQRERGPQEWQQGGLRRGGSQGGGYGEYNYAKENQRFGDWESQRRYPEGERFGREYSRQGGRSDSGFFSEREQQRGFAGRGPKNYKRSDQRIQEEVCDRLTSDPEVDASEIQVEVKNGEVTLEGSVSERGMKRCAEECVEDVSGVSQVHNRLRVAPASQSQGAQGQQGSESWGQQRGAEQQRADQPGTSQSRTGRIA